LLAIEGLPCAAYKTVLEGGALQTDGVGTLITTESVLLNPNRNAGLTRRLAERMLRQRLGIQKVIWLPKGLQSDETGGHVDNVCVFVDEAHVVVAVGEDKSSREAMEFLRSQTDALGRRLRLTLVPLPVVPPMTVEEAAGIRPSGAAISRNAGDALAASYVNFYQGNGLLLAPTFGVSTDEPAVDALSEALPHREVIPLPCRELALAGGGPHCVTRDIPTTRRVLRDDED
jgi:agmatine deiminase